MSKDLNWAVLGTGVIANEMAAGLQKMGKTLYAVGNRTYSKAVAFAEKYGIKKVYAAIDEMFVDDDVDIVYITSPHNTHYGFMKKALENGKHLLVEKSITLNSQELDGGDDDLAYAAVQGTVEYCEERRTGQSSDDHCQFWQFQRIQYGESLF